VAVAVAPAEVGFSAEAVALILGFVVLWLAITILDAIRPPLLGIFGAVPLVGGALRAAIDGALGAVRGWLVNYLSQALVAYATLLDWLDTLWVAISGIVTEWATLSVYATFRITSVIIPAEVTLVREYAAGLAAAATARAESLFVSAETLARGLFAVAEQDTAAAVAAVEAEAVRLAAAERAAAQGLFAVAETDIARAVAVERSFTVNEILGVQAEIEAAIAKAQAISAAAEAALRGDLGTVEGKLAGEIRDQASSLLRQIEADKAALAAALAGGIAGVVADIAAIRALRCIQQCETLGAWGELLGALNVGAIVALYELAVHDPGAAAGFLSGTLTPALEGFEGQAKSILGA
jgi:hypothetical protein